MQALIDKKDKNIFDFKIASEKFHLTFIELNYTHLWIVHHKGITYVRYIRIYWQQTH